MGAPCWPTPDQEWLLKAALLPGAESLTAWRTWRSLADMDALDFGSDRLLPLLYHNLKEQGILDPALARLKDAYRLTWSQNQLLFHDAAALLSALHGAGIRTMVLKGAALVEQYYRDPGLRPMMDFDILVPTEQVMTARRVLVERGWQPKWRLLETFAETAWSIWHAQGFLHPSGRMVDLHWHMLPECCYPGADDDFWARAVPIAVAGVSTCAPCPTDHLLLVCSHGAHYRALPQFRWVADAMMILGAENIEIDWEWLTVQAEARRLILPLRHTLRYLREELEASIPPATLDSLQNMPVSWMERLEYRAATHPQGILGRLPMLWARSSRYVRGSRSGPLKPKFRGFIAYLQRYWGLANVGQLLVHIAAKGWHQIRKPRD